MSCICYLSCNKSFAYMIERSPFLIHFSFLYPSSPSLICPSIWLILKLFLWIVWNVAFVKSWKLMKTFCNLQNFRYTLKCFYILFFFWILMTLTVATDRKKYTLQVSRSHVSKLHFLKNWQFLCATQRLNARL